MSFKRILNKITPVIVFSIACVIFTIQAQAAELPATEGGVQGVKTVDLVLFVGQSNMSGFGGNAALAPAVPNDMGYEFRPLSDPSGLHPIVEPFGSMEGGYLSDPGSLRGGTMVSSFANAYYAATGVPIVAVSACRGGSDSAFFASGPVKSELLNKFVQTKSFLQMNHITVRRAFAVFLQGETDALKGVKPAQYQANVLAAFSPLFVNGLQRVYVITPGRAKGNIVNYDSIVQAQIDLCSTDSRFTLASTMLRTMSDASLADEVHYNQSALNSVGSSAAGVAARY